MRRTAGWHRMCTQSYQQRRSLSDETVETLEDRFGGEEDVPPPKESRIGVLCYLVSALVGAFCLRVLQ